MADKKYRNIKIIYENISLKKNIEFISFVGPTYKLNQYVYKKFTDMGFEFYGVAVGGMTKIPTKVIQFYQEMNPKSPRMALGERLYYGVKMQNPYPSRFDNLDDLCRQKIDVVFIRVIDLHRNRKRGRKVYNSQLRKQLPVGSNS